MFSQTLMHVEDGFRSLENDWLPFVYKKIPTEHQNIRLELSEIVLKRICLFVEGLNIYRGL
jgi:hypothetical protein